eukprot:353925-Chlamydomonas_euryale.AAC.6
MPSGEEQRGESAVGGRWGRGGGSRSVRVGDWGNGEVPDQTQHQCFVITRGAQAHSAENARIHDARPESPTRIPDQNPDQNPRPESPTRIPTRIPDQNPDQRLNQSNTTSLVRAAPSCQMCPRQLRTHAPPPPLPAQPLFDRCPTATHPTSAGPWSPTCSALTEVMQVHTRIAVVGELEHEKAHVCKPRHMLG